MKHDSLKDALDRYRETHPDKHGKPLRVCGSMLFHFSMYNPSASITKALVDVIKADFTANELDQAMINIYSHLYFGHEGMLKKFEDSIGRANCEFFKLTYFFEGSSAMYARKLFCVLFSCLVFYFFFFSSPWKREARKIDDKTNTILADVRNVVKNAVARASGASVRALPSLTAKQASNYLYAFCFAIHGFF